MAISFEESLKQMAAEMASSESNPVATPAVEVSAAPSLMTLADNVGEPIAAYSGDDGNWIQDTKYKYYRDFSDDNISRIDEGKHIALDSKQFNITQEENSQYIPFEMPRQYDGYDLTKATLSIHYETSDGYHGVATPVNVSYNSSTIRFGWLVDAVATQTPGKLKFEIQAAGFVVDNTNTKVAYVWKTRINDSLNVSQSLCGETCNEVINVNDSWIQELVTAVAENVAEQIANVEIEGQVQAAQTAANTAQIAANQALESSDNAANIAGETVRDALVNYPTKTDVADAIAKADISEKLNDYYTKSDVDTKLDTTLADYATKQNVTDAIEAADISDKLNDYYTKSDADAKLTVTLNDYATHDDVANAIAAEDITTKLGNYYTKSETYNKSEIDQALDNVEVDLTDYATEEFVTGKTNALVSDITTNKGDIKTLGGTVAELQTKVNSIDTSPRLTYDVVYNDMEDENSGENKLVFYEIENEGKTNEVKTPKRTYVISGGGGGSASSNVLYISYDKDEHGNNVTSYIFTLENINDQKGIIYYGFDGIDPVGDSVSYANSTWQYRIGTSGAWTTIETGTIYPNTDSEFNVSEHITYAGTYQFKLNVEDESGGFATKTWTVQLIDVRIESSFNDTIFYEAGTVTFDYTPYGAVPKDIHFILYDDSGKGTEIATVTTASSGIPDGYELAIEEHGSHLLEVYMTATINGNTIESNHILKDIIVYEPGNTTPIIGCAQQKFTMQQYDTENIVYTVYDPSTETPSIEIADDGEFLTARTLTDSNTDIYPYKAIDIFTIKDEKESRDHVLTITCGDTVKALKVTVEEIDIDVSPVTAGLAFDFNPLGKSNSGADRVWTDGTVSMAVSDNFDWVNGGYQFDERGDQYFCIKAGTSATIDYQLFADDAKKNGKEFKLVFKTTNVSKPNATFLSCMDNTTNTDHIGIQMDVHEAYIYGQAGKLHLPYSEEDIIEFEFNISKDTEAVPMVMGYEDGVSTCPMVYSDSHSFTQSTPQIITLGSNDCDLHIYRFKVYNTSLTDRGILNNFIADARNAEEMVNRYERNQIYDTNQNLDPATLAEKCPWLRIIKVSAPHFTTGKKYPVGNTTIEYIYKNGDPVLDNWVATDCVHQGQGTSSDDYGASGRNMDLIMVPSYKYKDTEFNNTPVITLGDGKTTTDTVSLTRKSVPVDYFNIKVNIASSENANNALLQRRYNEYNPYERSFVREEGYDTSMIKDTMEFHNCVVFIQETDLDMSTHTEFADNAFHFYAIGNIGDSKKTDKTRLTDPDDRYECVNEIFDVKLPLSDFPIGDEAISILEAEEFDGKGTYEWRYIWEDGTDEENAEVAEYCKQKWIDFYKFVVNSTDEEFKARLGDYFVLDSALYYYLFTTRYTMVDNRAKNSFWHYGWTGEYDAEGNKIRKWDLAFNYDDDTSLGINNYGDMVYRYGLEDTDVDENGTEVFRESDSTFFCRLRDLFEDELKALYNTLEGKNAWHGEGLIKQFDDWQSEFPEELWRLDIERKYIRTYNSSHIDGKGDDQFLNNMAHGKKKYQRRQYERNQEKYMASKYQSSVASSDANSIIIRCVTPEGDLAVKPNYSLTLTPYAYMYLNVQYSNGILQVPVEELGKPITIPYDGDSTDIIKIYSAYSLQSIGDLSPLYARTINASSASKLKELIIGNATEGYDNPHLTSLTTGANTLLEKLNVENVSGLTQPLNLSVLNNLRELYAYGSNISGVTFADGGRIQIAELPAINAFTMRNLLYLTTFDIADFNNLTSFTVENCNAVDVLSILDKAQNVNRVRITGIDWELSDTSLLERLYGLSGIDKNGYNIDKSVLTGTVRVPVIGQHELYKYQEAWADLVIIPTTIIPQFSVTFTNYDGTILDTQYIDQFENAVDPITREVDPIPTPVKPSTIQYHYTFAGWTDGDNITGNELTNISSDRVLVATYTESVRNYKIEYVANGVVLNPDQEPQPYGSNIVYTGEIPTYTAEEPFKFYLFNRWDKSGILDGDFVNEVKTVNALFDSFTYTDGFFNDKDFSELSPVQIYALTKLVELKKVTLAKTEGAAGIYMIGDHYSFSLGYDVDYNDIESELIISEKMSFNGSNYYDSEIKLFDEDRDFVLAIDYKMASNNSNNNVLAQCFQSNGSNGFKLAYSNGLKFTWGSSSTTPASLDKREMIVLRHRKGEKTLTIYNSGLEAIVMPDPVVLSGGKSAITDSTLVFGCSRADDGAYENHAVGDIYWCKVWYRDLGDEACRQLASWTHEEIDMSIYDINRYYLSGQSKRASLSLLANTLLDRNRVFNSASSNVGGWAASDLSRYLNTRLYNALPVQTKALIKQVSVASSIGNKAIELANSDCYIFPPAYAELFTDSTANSDPYINEPPSGAGVIKTIVGNESRKRAHANGEYDKYWLRSPNVANTYGVWQVQNDGTSYGFRNANDQAGILIGFSF